MLFDEKSTPEVAHWCSRNKINDNSIDLLRQWGERRRGIISRWCVRLSLCSLPANEKEGSRQHVYNIMKSYERLAQFKVCKSRFKGSFLCWQSYFNRYDIIYPAITSKMSLIVLLSLAWRQSSDDLYHHISFKLGYSTWLYYVTERSHSRVDLTVMIKITGLEDSDIQTDLGMHLGKLPKLSHLKISRAIFIPVTTTFVQSVLHHSPNIAYLSIGGGTEFIALSNGQFAIHALPSSTTRMRGR